MPTEPATDLMTSILAQTQEQLNTNRETSRVVLENQNSSRELLAGISTLYAEVARDSSVVKAQENAAKLQVQAAVKTRALAFGVDVSANADRMVQLAMERTVAVDKADKELADLQRRADVKFTDSPLDFLGQQFFGIQEQRGKFRMAQGMVERKQAEIQQLNVNVQQTAQTYKALEESISIASADAATRNAAAQSTALAMDAKLRSIKNDSEAVLTVQNLSQSSLNSIYQATNALRAEEQIALSRKQFALSEKAFEFSSEERRLAREARTEGKELDDYILENINIGRASLGLEPYSGVGAKQQIGLYKAGKQDLHEMEKRGEASKFLGGIAVIGTDSADAINNLSKNPAVERTLPEIKVPVVGLLNRARDKIAADQSIDRKDGAKVIGALNKTVKILVAQQFAQADSSPDNIFNPGDLKQFLGNKEAGIPAPRAIANLSLYKKLIQPMAESGVDMSSPKLVVGAVYSALKDGKITLNDAVELSQVYRIANEYNQKARGLRGFGIDAPNNGKNLNLTLGKYGQVFDVADPLVLARRFINQLAIDKFNAAPAPEITSTFPRN